MIVCSPISTCAKNVIHLSAHFQSQMGSKICAAVSRGPSSSCCLYLNPGHSKTNYGSMFVFKTLSSPSCTDLMLHGSCFRSCFSNQRGNLRVKSQRRNLEISLAFQNLNMKLLVPKQGMLPKIKCNVGPVSWPQGCASVGLIFGLLVRCSSSEPAHAEAAHKEEKKGEESYVKFSHGKKVYTDYSIIGDYHFLPSIYTVFIHIFNKLLLVHQILYTLKLLMWIDFILIRCVSVDNCFILCRYTWRWEMSVPLCCSWGFFTIRETSSKWKPSKRISR